jgi:hypothetical protein
LASTTQVPAAVKCTVVPDTLHTPEPLEASTENTTGLPEPPPVADKSAADPAAAGTRAAKEIDCGSLPTPIVRWTGGAAVYLALPAWLALTTQLPAAVYVTVEPDTRHTSEPPENTTGLPEPPPVADKTAESPTFPDAGAVKVMDWESPLTVIVRWTWGAAVYLALPAWLASTTQLPAAAYVTVVPDTRHTPGPLAASTENRTGLPEPPPAADKDDEPAAAPAAGPAKEIDWVDFGRVV